MFQAEFLFRLPAQLPEFLSYLKPHCAWHFVARHLLGRVLLSKMCFYIYLTPARLARDFGPTSSHFPISFAYCCLRKFASFSP